MTPVLTPLRGIAHPADNRNAAQSRNKTGDPDKAACFVTEKSHSTLPLPPASIMTSPHIQGVTNSLSDTRYSIILSGESEICRLHKFFDFLLVRLRAYKECIVSIGDNIVV